MSGEGAGHSDIPELRTAAIAVWRYWHMEGKNGSEAWAAMLETEARQSRRVEQFRAELFKIVGERDDISIRLNGGCVEAVVEDLHFISYEFTTPRMREPCMMVSLLGRCPSCGTETRSEPVVSLAGLGKHLENFEPAYEHFCPSRRQGQSGKS